MDLTTPALLFPAISLLLLAYTNRFLSLAALVRSLAPQTQTTSAAEACQVASQQLDNLRRRIGIIRRMQEAGVLSFIFCVLSMLLIYLELDAAAFWTFGASLALLIYSLLLSVLEIRISQRALDIFLDNLAK
ncbi:DUF2721 domain-containing protein [Ferrimonas marina]|uniref:DUF2721 domain-containing protein n=1 Tax=Ferrimonas marina TaxID=299255 RepID=A0A1M5X1L4_9GAMM|nr:DUF2721 domain-containing protein [Ferrimonas marina]SHH93776.1 Protein of unknown function [Ferrimonas marina]